MKNVFGPMLSHSVAQVLHHKRPRRLLAFRGSGIFPRMSPPGARQRKTAYKVWPDNVSPDDVLRLVREREARELADTRTELERFFGDPQPSRSALGQRLMTPPTGARPAPYDAAPPCDPSGFAARAASVQRTRPAPASPSPKLLTRPFASRRA